MPVSISAGSAKIAFTAKPRLAAPTVSGTDMAFNGSPIRATGEVTLLGHPGDSAAGWTVGFIQAQWIETNWCSYRGQHSSDGSIFIQRARPPARPRQACRDCVDGSPVDNVFYSTDPLDGEIASGGPGVAFPLKLSVAHFDKPSEACSLVETNGTTRKPNFLAEAQLEFHFCTVLTVKDPAGAFHHQLAFYWNTRWQATFHPTSFSVPPAGMSVKSIAAGTGTAVSHIIQGTPTDARFAGVLTAHQAQTCNQVFRAARAAIGPGTPNRHESAQWQTFDVRKA